jgi:hypothetical protein
MRLDVVTNGGDRDTPRLTHGTERMCLKLPSAQLLPPRGLIPSLVRRLFHASLQIRRSPHIGGLSERTTCTMATCRKCTVPSSDCSQAIECEGQGGIVALTGLSLGTMGGDDAIQPGGALIGIGVDDQLIECAAHLTVAATPI